jgi:hypothetical protein
MVPAASRPAGIVIRTSCIPEVLVQPDHMKTPTRLEPVIRTKALWQGVLGVFGALAWLGALIILAKYVPNLRERLPFILLLLFCLVGLAVSVVGIWRLSVARNLRWDWRGVAALCLMLFLGLPTLSLWLFYVVLLLSPPGSLAGRN